MANALVTSVAPPAAQPSESNPPVTQSAPAQVWTDKADYHPGELVTIYGSGFTANTPVALTVTKLKDNTTTNWSTISDTSGNLTTTYQIDPQGAPLYRIDASDGIHSITYFFTDSSYTLSVTDVEKSQTGTIGDTLAVNAGDSLSISATYSGSLGFGLFFETVPGYVTYGNIVEFTHDSWEGSYTIPIGTTPGNYQVGMWSDSALICRVSLTVTSTSSVSSFGVSGPSSATASSPFSVTVTAKDSGGSTVTGYTGTIHFTSSDTASGVTLPSDYTFTASDNGVHTFTNGVTLKTAGTQTVTVTAGSKSGTSSSITVTNPPVSQLSSTSGNVGDTVTVTGSGFGNSQSFTVTYGGTTVASSTTTATGTIPSGTTFTVPASTAGAHTVTVTQGRNSATATFTVTPKITLTPTSGGKDTVVTVAGTGFGSSTNINLRYETILQSTTPSTVITDSSGSFSCTFVAPSGNAGARTVQAQWGANSASATFTLTPTITLTPNSGLTGTSVTVTGVGFSAYSTVTFSYDGTALTTNPSTVTTTSSGASSCTFIVPISTGGDHTIQATQGVNSAQATYTVTTISQPITVTMANGAPSATVYITGGNPSPSSFAADGNQHIITMDPGASFTLSFSNDGNTRNGFNVASTFSSVSSSYTSSTSAISLTAYNQVQNTFTASGLSGSDSVAVTGYFLGTSGSTIVTLTGTSSSLQAWSDYNQPVSYPTISTSSGVSERWAISPAYTTTPSTSGGGTVTPTYAYTHQYKQTLSYILPTSGTPSTTPYISGTAFGSSYTPSLTTSATGYWFDASGSVTFSDIVESSGEKFTATLTSISATSAHTQVVSWYHQYQVTLAYTTGDGGTITSGTKLGTYKALGANTDFRSTATYGASTASNVWIDAGTSKVSFSTTVVINDRWALSSTPHNINVGSAGTLTETGYYHQVINQFSVTGLSNPDSLAVTGTVRGVAGSTIATLNNGNGYTATGWSDYNTAVTFPATSTQSGSEERWARSSAYTLTFTTGGSTISPPTAYVHQFKVTFTASGGDILADSDSTIVTVDGAAKTRTDLPYSTWIANGASVSWQYSSSVLAAANYIWASTSGLGTSGQSGILTVSSAGTITGTYTPRLIQRIRVSMANGAPSATVTISGGNPLESTIPANGNEYTVLMDAGANFTLSFTNEGNTRNGFNVGGSFSSVSNSYTASTSAISETAYKQVQNTFSVSGLSGTDSVAISGTFLGSAATIVTLTATSSSKQAWSDYNKAVTIPAISMLSSSTERWALSSDYTTTPSAIGGGTVSPTTAYAHQYPQTLSYQLPTGGTPSTTPSASGTQFGSSYTPTLNTTPTDYWFDASGTVTFNIITVSADERWVPQPSDVSALSAHTQVVSWFHQYTVSFAYSTHDSLAIPVGSQIGSYLKLGQTTPLFAGSSIGSTNPASDWVDAGAATVAFTTYASGSGTERWALSASPHRVAVTGTGNITEIGYCHQYRFAISWYPVNYPTTGDTLSPSITFKQYGSDYVQNFTQSGTFCWLDAGSTWNVSSQFFIGSATQRFATSNTTTGTLTGPATILFKYYRQFLQTLSYQIMNGEAPASAPTFTYRYHCTQFGVNYNLSLTTTPTEYWIDNDVGDAGNYAYINSIPGVTNERWAAAADVSIRLDVANTYVFRMYHQYALERSGPPPFLTYTTQDGRRIPTNTVLGKAYYCGTEYPLYAADYYGGVLCSYIWLDAGVNTVSFNTSTTAAGSERWALTSPQSFNLTSPDTITINYYHQYAITPYCTLNDGGSPTFTGAVQYTSFGAAATAAPTPGSTGGSAIWADKSTTIAYTSQILNGANERWIMPSVNTATYTVLATVTSGQTVTAAYTHQYLQTLNYQVNGGGNPAVTGAVQYTSNGTSQTATPTPSGSAGTAVWADSGTAITYKSPIAGDTGEQWTIGVHDLDYGASGKHTVIESVTRDQSVTATYYHQYLYTVKYAALGGGTPAAYPLFTAAQCDSPSYINTPLSTSESDYWVNAGTSWQISSELGSIAGPNERWAASQTTGEITGPATVTYNYYHQYKTTFNYRTSDDLTIPSGTQLGTYIYCGDSKPLYAGDTYQTFSSPTVWVDAGTGKVSYANVTVGSERWLPSSSSSDITMSLWINQFYTHQYQFQINYEVNGGGSPSAPILTSKQNAAAYTPTLDTNASSSYWLDAGSTWSINSLLGGSNSPERWISSQTLNGTVTAPVTATYTYYHQCMFTLRYLCFGGWPASGGQPSITAKQCGLDYVQAFTATATGYWFDAGSWSVTEVLDGSNSTERWATSQVTGNLTAPTYTQFNYYHQLLQTLSYQVAGDGAAPPSAPVVKTGYQFGAAYEPALTTTPAQFWFDPSSGSYLSVEIPGIANERWRSDTFNLNTVNSAVIPIYHQYQVPTSLTYTTQDGSAIPEHATIGTANCYGTTNNIEAGASYGSANNALTWADAGINTVTFSTCTAAGGKERWALSSPQSFNITSSDTITVNYYYYHQYAITPYYTVPNEGSPNVTDAIHYTSIGTSQTGTPTKGTSHGTPIWADNGTAIAYTSPISGATRERWQIANGDTGLHTVLESVNASQTVTAAYYHQLLQIFSYQAAGDGVAPPSAPVMIYGLQYGSHYEPTLTTTPTEYWIDYNATYNARIQTISGVKLERWCSESNVDWHDVNTYVFSIYHQYAVTYTRFQYTTHDDSVIPQSSRLGTAYYCGNINQIVAYNGSAICPRTWVDAGINAATFNTYTTAAGSERWALTSPQNFNLTSPTDTITVNYYHQYTITPYYTVIDLTSPTVTDAVHYTANGSSATAIPTLGDSGGSIIWADNGTSIAYTSPIAGASGERWAISATDLTTNTVLASVNASQTITAAYYHQLLQTLSYQVAGGGAAPPSTPTIQTGFTQFGSTYAPSLMTTPTGYWFDYTNTLMHITTITKTANERWYSEQWFDPSNSSTVVYAVYHQFKALTTLFAYTTHDSIETPYMATIGTAHYCGAETPIRSDRNYGVALADKSWIDAGVNAVTFDTYTVDETERWALASPQSFNLTSSDTITVNYYHQYTITPYYTVIDLSSPNVTGAVHYTANGSSATASPTLGALGGTAIWADNGTAISYTSPISGATGERWQIASGDSGLHQALAAVNASQTITASYSHQYLQTLSYQVINGGTAAYGPFVSEGKQFGAAYSPILTTSATGYWFDAQTDIGLYNPVAGAAGERWYVNSDVDSTKANTKIIPLYHQYNITFAYATSDGSTIPVGNIIGHFTFAGIELLLGPGAAYGDVQTMYDFHWVDAGNDTASFDTVTPDETERWALTTSTHSFDVTGSGTLNETGYYHQYQQTLSYQVVGTVPPPSAPTPQYGTQFGSKYAPSLTKTPTGYWFDCKFGSIPIKEIPGTANERWNAKEMFRTEKANTLVYNVYHQFELTATFLTYTTQDGLSIPAGARIGTAYLFGTETTIFSYSLYGVGLAANAWIDGGVDAVIFDTYTAASGTERWALASPQSFDIFSPDTITVNYYHQFAITPYYTVNNGGGIPTVTDVVHYTANGVPSTAAPTLGNTEGTAIWADKGSAISYTSPIIGATGERWQIVSGDSGLHQVLASVNASQTITEAYYHQYSITFGYNVIGGSSTPGVPVVADPTVHYTQFGSTSTATALTSDGPNVWVDASTDVTYSNPLTIAGLPDERWQFDLPIAGDLSTVEASVSSSKTLNPAYYHQAHHKIFAYGLSGTDYVEVSGTYFGTLNPALAILNASNAYSVYPWFDYNTAVTIPYSSAASTANERWEYRGKSLEFINATGSWEWHALFIHQYRNLYTITGLTDTNTATVTVVDTPNNNYYPSKSVTLSSTNGWSAYAWSDAETSATFSTSSADTANERWITPQTSTDTITSGGNTYTRQYIHQYKATLNYAILGGGSATAPTLTATQNATAYTPTLDTNPSSYWLDAGSSWSIKSLLAGSGATERWSCAQTLTGNVTEPMAATFNYYHQHPIDVYYWNQDTSTIPSGLQLGTYTSYGSSQPLTAGAAYGAITPSNPWVDAGNDRFTFSTATDGSQRWALPGDSASYTVTGYISAPANYFHQYKCYIDYAVAGGGSPTAPMLSATQLVVAYTPTLDGSASSSYWLDAGTAWSVNSLLDGSGANEQWICSQPLTGTATAATAGSSTTYTYTHQYKVTFDASANVLNNGVGTILTLNSADKTRTDLPLSAWYDSGSTVTYAYQSNIAPATDPARNNYAYSSTSGLGQTTQTGALTVNAAGTVTATYTLQTATSIDVIAADPATAGSAGSFTVTVKDAAGQTMTHYTGTVHFTSTDAQAVLPADYTFQLSDAGTKTFSYTLKTAGSNSITPTDTTVGSITGSDSVTVNPSSATQFVLSAPASTTAGTAFSVTVTAKDAYGNIATGYRGTVNFTSTDTAATVTLPANYTFTALDSGVHTFSIILTTAGTPSVTAADTYNAITKSASLTVNAASLATIVVGVTSNSVIAGNSVAFNNMGYDQYNNALGAQSVTYTVNGQTVPSASALRTAAGTYTVSVTTPGVTVTAASFTVNAGSLARIDVQVSQHIVAAGSSVNFYTQGSDQYGNSLGQQAATFTVNGTAITGNSVTETVPGTYIVSITGASVTAVPASFQVSAGSLASIVVAVSSTNVTAGTPVLLTATGYDQNRNVVDLQNVTFTVNGSPIQGRAVTETLVGDYLVSVSGGSATVTAASFHVHYADADHIVVASSSGSITAGESASHTVTAVDQYGNTWDTTGQAVFSINCPSGDYYWVANAVTVNKAGQWTITASFGDITGTATLTVAHAAANTIAITPTTTTTVAGTPVAYTATAQDTYGNSWDISSQTSWNSNAAAGASWSSSTFTGTNTVSYTITGTYAGKSASATLTVTPAPLDHFTISSPASAGQQTAFSITVTAYDAYNNTVTGYTGTANLAASSGSISPSATGSFASGVWTGNVALSSPGSQTITVSGNGKSGTSQVINVNPAATPTPTPTPTPTATPTPSPTSEPSVTPTPTPTPTPTVTFNSTTIIATETTTQETYNVTVNGNIAAQQMSNMTITSYQANGTTVVAFTVTGPAGTTGYANLTLPKSAIPYGTKPVIYIDGVEAPNQGYTEDENNYYLWYSTHFSTHQITIRFETQPQPPASDIMWLYLVLIAVILVVVLFVVLFAVKSRKKDNDKTSRQ